jgi:hypothetical protein
MVDPRDATLLLEWRRLVCVAGRSAVPTRRHLVNRILGRARGMVVAISSARGRTGLERESASASTWNGLRVDFREANGTHAPVCWGNPWAAWLRRKKMRTQKRKLLKRERHKRK